MMKPLLEHLDYAFLEKDSLLPVVISALLKDDERKRLISVLKKNKEAFAWKISGIPGISPSFCKHKINFEDDAKPVIQRQHQLNPNMKKELYLNLLLDAVSYTPLEDSPLGWPCYIDYIHPKLNDTPPKRSFHTLHDQMLKEFMLIPNLQHLRAHATVRCNQAHHCSRSGKSVHFPGGQKELCVDTKSASYGNGILSKFRHEAVTFPSILLVQAILSACSIPIGWAYAFHQDKASSVRVPVANFTLQSSVEDNFEELPLEENLRIKNSIQDPPTDLMMKPLLEHLDYAFLEKDSLLPVVISALLKDDERKRLISVLKKHKEAFAWKISDSFDSYLANLEQMLVRCKQAHLVLKWEKCHFMVTEGIVLGHKVSSARLEVDKAKINVIAKLPPPINVKAVRSFLEHAGFYRRFIKDFSKISRHMTKLLEKDTVFNFNKECICNTLIFDI
ncbi:hypothetical protein Tco_1090433 [Tanacetum coccineum]|uniref:Reverse transcriptase domain-containing protein n=1 Tax=Tanacetum coccineum TaxID=301880 RepID=A0ABQ5I472_9ASTR